MIRSLSNRPREQPLEASVSLADHPPLIHAKGAALGRPRTGELGYLLGLVGIINLGLAIRALHVASGGGFPLNDGGMFFAMIEDVKRASFALPEYTSYNGGDIPFAYPPFGFYLAALLSKALGWGTLDLLRLLPLLASGATIGAFHLLARRLLPDRSTALFATLLFALAPRAFNWEIVGGGLTRSFGLLFAVLAVAEGLQLIRHGGRRRILTTTVFCSLALLTHLEMAMFAAYSLGLLYLAKDRSRRGFGNLVLVGVGALALTAPWWEAVLQVHGPEPFLSAAQAGNHSPLTLLALPLYNFTEEPFFPLIGALGLLGFAYSIGTRQYLLPLWLLIIFVLDPRKGPTFAIVPMSLMGAVAIRAVVLPLLSDGRQAVGGIISPVRGSLASWPLTFGVALAIGLYGGLAGIAARADALSPLLPMPPETREALEWVHDNAEPAARFVVITGADRWALDPVSEWFPELTGRVSVGTVQGYEWMGRESYAHRQRDYHDLQECSEREWSCLESWAISSGQNFSHVFLPVLPESFSSDLRECCAALRIWLLVSPEYALVYEGPGGWVFIREQSRP